MRKIERIALDATDRERLERLVRDRNTPQKIVWRARIVMAAAEGLNAGKIAAAVGKSVLTVRRWRRRYMERGGWAAEGRDPSATPRAAGGGEGQAGGGNDAARTPAQRDPLELAHHGGSGRSLLQQRPTDMAGARVEAAFDPHLQGLS